MANDKVNRDLEALIEKRATGWDSYLPRAVDCAPTPEDRARVMMIYHNQLMATGAVAGECPDRGRPAEAEGDRTRHHRESEIEEVGDRCNGATDEPARPKPHLLVGLGGRELGGELAAGHYYVNWGDMPRPERIDGGRW